MISRIKIRYNKFKKQQTLKRKIKVDDRRRQAYIQGLLESNAFKHSKDFPYTREDKTFILERGASWKDRLFFSIKVWMYRLEIRRFHNHLRELGQAPVFKKTKSMIDSENFIKRWRDDVEEAKSKGSTAQPFSGLKQNVNRSDDDAAVNEFLYGKRGNNV